MLINRIFIIFLSSLAMLAVLHSNFLSVRIFNAYNFNKSLALSNIAKYKLHEESLIDENMHEESNREADLKNIKATAYLIYDLQNGAVLEGMNEENKYPLASITKLMTAHVAYTFCKDNLKEKLDSLLIASDNNAADIIAMSCPNYEGFIKMMNDEAIKNKLNMTFVNPSGLDIKNETEASNYGDALGVAKLIEIFYKNNPILLEHTTKEVYNTIRNTNSHVKGLPFLIGSKTGFTDVAGGNLVTMYEVLPGKRVAIVVFGSTREDRFVDTFILLKYYLNNLK